MHRTFTESSSEDSVLIYEAYVEACSAINIKPSSANFVGKIIGEIFPKVTAKRARSKENSKMYQRKYFGLKRCNEIDTRIDDMSTLSFYLPNNTYVSNQTEDYVVIGCNTSNLCEGHKVAFDVHLKLSGEVSINLGTTTISHNEYGLWKRLPLLTALNLKSFLKGLQSIKMCQGIPAEKGDLRKVVSKIWKFGDNEQETCTHSLKCRGVLTILNSSKVCYECQHVFRKMQELQPSTPTPSKNPKETCNPKTPVQQVAHACVGTTPLKCAEDVLLKFFPHLKTEKKSAQDII